MQPNETKNPLGLPGRMARCDTRVVSFTDVDDEAGWRSGVAASLLMASVLLDGVADLFISCTYRLLHMS